MSQPQQPSIRLDQFLKAQNLADTGGQAKRLIQEGMVQVNGETETRRRRQQHEGDVVQLQEQAFTVEFQNGDNG